MQGFNKLKSVSLLVIEKLLLFSSVFRMFLGILDPDPDPLVRGTDPDPFIIKQN
jgi:hypothetical protein